MNPGSQNFGSIDMIVNGVPHSWMGDTPTSATGTGYDTTLGYSHSMYYWTGSLSYNYVSVWGYENSIPTEDIPWRWDEENSWPRLWFEKGTNLE
jgi:hypothetical protein